MNSALGMGQMLTESAVGITVGVGFGRRPSHNPPELAGLIVCCFAMQGEQFVVFGVQSAPKDQSAVKA
jgi:hypothetical protein